MKITRHACWLVIPILIGMLASCTVERNPLDPVDTGKGPMAGKAFEPMFEIMNAVDNIKLIGEDGSETVYEDAENGNVEGWLIGTNNGNASLRNVVDLNQGSRVIQFFDNNTGIWYYLGNGSSNWSDAYWNNTEQFIIEWSAKFNVYFVVRVMVVTTDGFWVNMEYSADDYLGAYPDTWPPNQVYLPLGTDAADGTWKTFTRDLQADLQSFFPEGEIQRVLMFKIVGKSEKLPPPEVEARTPGFWKNNIRKFLEGKTNGVQVEAGRLQDLLDLAGGFYESPLNELNGTVEGAEAAYEILSIKRNNAVSKLKKHLLAAELNYFHGAYITGGQEATIPFLTAGEDMLLNPGSRGEVHELKDLYDMFNNGGSILWE